MNYRIRDTYPLKTVKQPLAYPSLIGVMRLGGRLRQALSLRAWRAFDSAPLLTNFVKLDDHWAAPRGAIDKADGKVRMVFGIAGGQVRYG